jgi:hypothetical protein
MLSDSELHEGMHLVGADGVVSSAGDAAVELAGVLGGPGALLFAAAHRAGWVRAVVCRAYQFVAVHRAFIGRAVPHRDAIRSMRPDSDRVL